MMYVGSNAAIKPDLPPEERHRSNPGDDGVVPTVELRFRREDREEPVWLACYSEVITYQGRECLLSWGYDISKRKALEQELERQSRQDMLTALPNRRAFFAEAEFLLQDPESLNVILLDLDRFKTINDTYGHDVGDAVLQQVAEVLRRELAGTGFAARLGGEEFGVLCRGQDLEATRALAERIRAALDAEPIRHEGGTLTATASIGVSSVMADESRIEPAMKRADAAMYRAKHCGRNRVEVARVEG
jgi:diguanylate cyclase (GGDEF)-like protein